MQTKVNTIEQSLTTTEAIESMSISEGPSFKIEDSRLLVKCNYLKVKITRIEDTRKVTSNEDTTSIRGDFSSIFLESGNLTVKAQANRHITFVNFSVNGNVLKIKYFEELN